MDTIAKTVAGVQTVLLHLETVAAAVANRARFRLPQKSKILRIGASFRASLATDLQVMVEVDGVDALTGVIDKIAAQPAAPVAVAGTVADALTLGSHSWKTTFVDAVGESAGSAKSNVLTLAAPTAVTAALAGAGAGNVDDGDHSYKVTFENALGESVASPKSNVLTVADKSANGKVALTNVPTGPAGTTARNLYRTVAGDAGDWLFAGTIADNTTVTYTDNLADAGLGAAAPVAAGLSATITIPLGPTGTTARKVYRTDAGDGGNAKLVGTVANNTATTFVDNIPDGAGAAAPTVDTRGQGLFTEGVLDTTITNAVVKEAEITLDVETLTGTSVADLCVQIDMVRLD